MIEERITGTCACQCPAPFSRPLPGGKLSGCASTLARSKRWVHVPEHSPQVATRLPCGNAVLISDCGCRYQQSDGRRNDHQAPSPQGTHATSPNNCASVPADAAASSTRRLTWPACCSRHEIRPARRPLVQEHDALLHETLCDAISLIPLQSRVPHATELGHASVDRCHFQNAACSVRLVSAAACVGYVAGV